MYRRSIIALALSLCAACESAERLAATPPTAALPSAPYPDRDPALAQQLVEQHGALLLDVRTSAEFKAGHLEGAKNISHDQLGARISEVASWVGDDKTAPVVVYCRSGRRSGIARTLLEDAGYTRVTNVGGMNDYPQPPPVAPRSAP